jgi:hypothetical protein
LRIRRKSGLLADKINPEKETKGMQAYGKLKITKN